MGHHADAMKKLALLSCVLVSVACSNAAPAAEGEKKVAAEAPAAVAQADATPAKADAEAEEENGCIYVDGEKDGEHGAEDEKAGCPHGDAADGALAQADAGHFGDPFALAAATPLSEVVSKGEAKGDVQVSGEVEAVCQKKGCWMVVKDGEISARVLMKDHGFSVPKDARGKKVRVEGVLTSRTFTEAQVKHLEKDGGGDPSEVSGTRKEHVLTASGIDIQS